MILFVNFLMKIYQQIQQLTMNSSINYNQLFQSNCFLKQKDNEVVESILKNSKNILSDSNQKPKHNLLNNQSYISAVNFKLHEKQNKSNCYNKIEQINYHTDNSVEKQQNDCKQQIHFLQSQYINKDKDKTHINPLEYINISNFDNFINSKIQDSTLVSNAHLFNRIKFLESQLQNKECELTLRNHSDKRMQQLTQNLRGGSNQLIHLTSNRQQNQLKNTEIEYKLRLQSLAKQYELKLQKQSQLYKLQIWRLKQDLQTMNTQIKNTKTNVNFIKFEETSSCTLCSNGQIIKSLQKIIQNLSKDHDGCLTQKRNFTMKYSQIERQLKELKQQRDLQKTQIQNLINKNKQLLSSLQYYKNNHESTPINLENKYERWENTRKIEKNQLITGRNTQSFGRVTFKDIDIKKQPLRDHINNLNNTTINEAYKQHTSSKNKFLYNEKDKQQYKNKKYYMNTSVRKQQQSHRRRLNIKVQQEAPSRYTNVETFRPTSIRTKSYHYNV